MDEPHPLHPSFEARDGVPDRVATMLSPTQAAHQVDAWSELLAASPSFLAADCLHLHHLTALHEAAARVAPGVPVVTHLHGTELKLLAAIEAAEESGELGQPGGHFEYGAHWRERMRAAADMAARTIVISPHDRTIAAHLLGIDPATVTWLPNGVDTSRFHPRELPAEERRGLWRRWLVDDAQGWSEGGEPGSIRYDAEHVDRAFGFAGNDAGVGAADPPPVLLYVGRFLDFKRVPLLVRAYAAAREQFARPVPLVIWGGAPGEFEGEHPATVARELGVDDTVFFAGWRGHADLPLGLACSSLLVAPSTDEPFGQVYLEAMACGLPVIGTQSGGPPSFVNVDSARPDGWLVTPDDEAALTAAIVEAVAAPGELAARGANALEHVRAGYTWTGLAPRFEAVYADAVASR
jgi:glycosyltransferase involved in cell wall biosynthesis